MTGKLEITWTAAFVALPAAACGTTGSERISGGGATEPETVNLGRPPWSNPEVRVPGTGQR